MVRVAADLAGGVTQALSNEFRIVFFSADACLCVRVLAGIPHMCRLRIPVDIER